MYKSSIAVCSERALCEYFQINSIVTVTVFAVAIDPYRNLHQLQRRSRVDIDSELM